MEQSRTILHRRRIIPSEMNNANNLIINSMIQGSAADIEKRYQFEARRSLSDQKSDGEDLKIHSSKPNHERN